MRQTDRCTAENVLNIVREVKDHSRMLQRVSIVMYEQKTINSILMNLHPVQSVTAPARKELHCHPDLQRSTLT